MNTQIQAHLWRVGGGCPKVSGPEGRTQKLRKQLGVREVLGPASVTFPHPGPLLIELLLRRLFYRPQKQLSIWFPLFLCWQGNELASFCPRMDVLLIHKERWQWFIHTHWVLVTVLRPWSLWGLFCVAGLMFILIAIQRNNWAASQDTIEIDIVELELTELRGEFLLFLF